MVKHVFSLGRNGIENTNGFRAKIPCVHRFQMVGVFMFFFLLAIGMLVVQMFLHRILIAVMLLKKLPKAVARLQVFVCVPDKQAEPLNFLGMQLNTLQENAQ